MPKQENPSSSRISPRTIISLRSGPLEGCGCDGECKSPASNKCKGRTVSRPETKEADGGRDDEIGRGAIMSAGSLNVGGSLPSFIRSLTHIHELPHATVPESSQHHIRGWASHSRAARLSRPLQEQTFSGSEAHGRPGRSPPAPPSLGPSSSTLAHHLGRPGLRRPAR